MRAHCDKRIIHSKCPTRDVAVHFTLLGHGVVTGQIDTWKEYQVFHISGPLWGEFGEETSSVVDSGVCICPVLLQEV